ncbi:MAG: rhomboid family intramembrane serine protease [Caldiserica bacterium]|jgi:membrane associated rhomboid family serine protease|nr:rhomboid family intramembrane serine protease [Caldisericota bacterium]MDH7562153.1 rhomboid family intramembrane serine protease [Caldisericota bacterium]
MVIPIYDINRRRGFPLITVSIILSCTLVFIYQLTLGLSTDAGNRFVTLYGAVPALILQGQNLPSIFSSMFLHGGWLHIIGNMFFLWVFGDNVEDFLGPIRFILFYLLSGVAAAYSYVLFSGNYPFIPMIGASGAISGVMGAYIYFFPRAPIITLIPLGIFSRVVPIPAWIYLLIWFGSQFLIAPSEGVAVQAHIGGFLAGIALAIIFSLGRRPGQTRQIPISFQSPY